MMVSDFVFDYMEGLFYKCPKVSFNCLGSYIDSPGWLINKKTTINPRNNNDEMH